VIAFEMSAVFMGAFVCRTVAAIGAEGKQPGRSPTPVNWDNCSIRSTFTRSRIAAALLLLAMIAAIALTLRDRKDSKAINAR
jgi:hypothetical protein